MPDARPRSPRPVVDRFAVALVVGFAGFTAIFIVAALWRICGGG